MRAQKSLISDIRASAALEFALIVPALMVLLFGTVEIGRFAFAYNSIDAALAKAGREWMIDPEIGSSGMKEIFCSRTHLIDCTETKLSVTTEIIDGQEWRILRADARFDSPLHPLIPIPTMISRTEHVPVFSDP